MVTSNMASGTGWSRITAQINGADGQIQLDNGPAGVGRGIYAIYSGDKNQLVTNYYDIPDIQK